LDYRVQGLAFDGLAQQASRSLAWRSMR